MATRSASTGVLVTLVTFVITTVALLVLSVFFFSKSQSSDKDLAAMKERLRTIATTSDLNSEDAKVIALSAQSSNKTMVEYLIDRNRLLGAQITGDRSKIADDKMITAAAKQMGVSDGGTVHMLVIKMKNDLDTQSRELEAMKKGVEELKVQLSDASKASAGAQGQPSEAMTKAMATLESLNKVADEYRAESEQVRQTLDEAKREFDQRMSQAKSSQEAEIGSLKSANARLETRLNEAGKKLSQFETKPSDPSSIVDGRVLEVIGDGETIFLDIGRRDRLQPGTTFEVFESAESIRSTDEQGLRGKASIQVMKVGDDTSTARVTRATPGRPILRGDVITNAVYSPKHVYRFLVHGKFDVDNDGRSTDDEANVIRNRIRSWGGVVAAEDRVTGDLDFIVLGMQPRRPIAPPATAKQEELEAYQRAQTTCDLYETIQREAKEAKIPILNLNRFQALTGMND
jgi:hypothetical protein